MWGVAVAIPYILWWKIECNNDESKNQSKLEIGGGIEMGIKEMIDINFRGNIHIVQNGIPVAASSADVWLITCVRHLD